MLNFGDASSTLVFPAPAGMNRNALMRFTSALGVPRACGDDPIVILFACAILRACLRTKASCRVGGWWVARNLGMMGAILPSIIKSMKSMKSMKSEPASRLAVDSCKSIWSETSPCLPCSWMHKTGKR